MLYDRLGDLIPCINLGGGFPSSGQLHEQLALEGISAAEVREPNEQCAEDLPRLVTSVCRANGDGSQTPSATILRCCSQESNSRHPARAGVKTVLANNVVRLGTPCLYLLTRYRAVNSSQNPGQGRFCKFRVPAPLQFYSLQSNTVNLRDE